ncbi:hypothetical protein Efla_007821 [Eimeria flavescens]
MSLSPYWISIGSSETSPSAKQNPKRCHCMVCGIRCTLDLCPGANTDPCSIYEVAYVDITELNVHGFIASTATYELRKHQEECLLLWKEGPPINRTSAQQLYGRTLTMDLFSTGSTLSVMLESALLRRSWFEEQQSAATHVIRRLIAICHISTWKRVAAVVLHQFRLPAHGLCSILVPRKKKNSLSSSNVHSQCAHCCTMHLRGSTLKHRFRRGTKNEAARPDMEVQHLPAFR